MPIIDNRFHSSKTICSICNSIIFGSSKTIPIYNLNAHVCEDCCNMFDDEDLELTINLLMIYGGYFAQYQKKGEFNIVQLLKAITTDLNSRSESIDPSKLNVLLMHRALLYGITPKEYLFYLNKQIED